ENFLQALLQGVLAGPAAIYLFARSPPVDRPSDSVARLPARAEDCLMSALPPKADMCSATRDVRFGPKADSCSAANGSLFGHRVISRQPELEHSTFGYPRRSQELPSVRLNDRSTDG